MINHKWASMYQSFIHSQERLAISNLILISISKSILILSKYLYYQVWSKVALHCLELLRIKE